MPHDTRNPRAPGKKVPYVLREGEGRRLLVAGQVIRLLAGVEETAGGFGAVTCEASHDPHPIPLHYHESEHDTWFCTRGRLQVWANDVSRILTAGDFAYVKPGDVHSYRSVAPRTSFFGVVAPGGWEGFFADAGEEWAEAGLPQANRPFDFARMGPAMGKYRIMRVPDAKFAELTNGDGSDRNLPAGPASYVLQSGYGQRRHLNGHLSTVVLSRRISDGMLDMRTIEGGRGAEMPMIRHECTHVLLYLLEGVLRLTLGAETHVLTAGDCANIPAGTPYRTRIESGQARWLLNGANGDGLEFWDRIGVATDDWVPVHGPGGETCAGMIGTIQDADVSVASL